MNAFRALRPVASRIQAPTLPRITRGFAASSRLGYEHIQVSEPRPGVGQVTLNRPKALNALSTPLIKELNTALGDYQKSDSISVIIITGSQKAFAAGADIKEMAPLTFSKAYAESFIENWSDLTTQVKKPIIAAVSGHALGGGCELALMCDFIYCTESANFGQPEIKLGIIPGAGGSQRLTKAVGKARAMELILTGKSMTGAEAAQWGVAARSFATYEELMEATLKTAETIAGYSKVAVQACKEVVNKSQDLGLRDGVEYERRVFHSLFGSQDQKIGMTAFAEKKKAEWTHHLAFREYTRMPPIRPLKQPWETPPDRPRGPASLVQPGTTASAEPPQLLLPLPSPALWAATSSCSTSAIVGACRRRLWTGNHEENQVQPLKSILLSSVLSYTALLQHAVPSPKGQQPYLQPDQGRVWVIMDSPKPAVDLETELTCAICTDLLYQPLTLLDCLHTFCGACLKDWFGWQAAAAESAPTPPAPDSPVFTCPSCRAPVRDTKHDAKVATLLDMFLTVNPTKAKPENEMAEMNRKYKRGDKVLRRLNIPHRTPEQLRLDEQERRLIEEVRAVSLQEAFNAAEAQQQQQQQQSSRSRRRTNEASPATTNGTGREPRSSRASAVATTRSREPSTDSGHSAASRARDARNRERTRRQLAEAENRIRAEQTIMLQPEPRHGEERRRRSSESHNRRPAESTDSRRRPIEHQSSIRSLISTDSGSLDIDREIEEFARQIQEEGLLDGLDLENIDLTNNDELSRKITEAYRRRQRERAQRNRTERRSDTSRSSGPRTSRTQTSESSSRPRRRSLSLSAPQAASNPHSRSTSATSQSEERSRPPVTTSPHLDAQANTRRRRQSTSRTRSSTTPLPSNSGQAPAQQSGQQLPNRSAVRSQTDIGYSRPAEATRPAIAESRSSSSPSMSTGIAQTEQASNVLPFSARVAGTPPAVNPSSFEKNVGRGRRVGRPLDIGIGPVLSHLASDSPPTMSPNPDSLKPRKTQQVYEEPNISCSACTKQHIEYEVHYNCDISNGEQFDSQPPSASSAQTPIPTPPMSPIVPSSLRPGAGHSRRTSSISSILTGPTSKFLKFTTTCDVCRCEIPPAQSRFHCYYCTSSLVTDSRPGDYDICESCYAGDRRQAVSSENGAAGWRRCPQAGHRMVVVGFREAKPGRWYRLILRDLVGGRKLKVNTVEGFPQLQRWSWVSEDGRTMERLVSVDVRERAIMGPEVEGLPAAAVAAGETTVFPPDGGTGWRRQARWAWYPEPDARDELMFPKGAEIREINDENPQWFSGTYMGERGVFPANYMYQPETEPGTESKAMDLEIDNLLERYLGLLDEYTKLREALGTTQRLMYQNIARANFSAERGMRYGPDHFDERMQAVRKLRVVDDESGSSPPGDAGSPRFVVAGPEPTAAPAHETSTKAGDDEGSRPEPGFDEDGKGADGAGTEDAQSEAETPREPTDGKIAPARPKDPLRWYGLFTPAPLRSAQGQAVQLVEEIVPRLATVTAEMASVEIEVRRARKKRAKAAARETRDETEVKHPASGPELAVA
ncbi:hypothetical protein PspLS_00359 [Pyricularia sp. CBS 133598]|nr:hypothetical protein PspLS_00359 [Pyricularia sp. CBS 133598]